MGDLLRNEYLYRDSQPFPEGIQYRLELLVGQEELSIPESNIRLHESKQ